MGKTANRGALLRKANKGLLVGRCEYDIMSDSRHDQGQGEWLPVHIYEPVPDSPRPRREGCLNLTEWDFKTKSGGAFTRPDGNIDLIVHGNCCYRVRIVNKPVNPVIKRYPLVVEV